MKHILLSASLTAAMLSSAAFADEIRVLNWQGYGTDTFEEMPTSIEVFWDSDYAGKVSIRDDACEAVQFAAIATGQDINNIADMGAVKAKRTALMPQIKTYWVRKTIRTSLWPLATQRSLHGCSSNALSQPKTAKPILPGGRN